MGFGSKEELSSTPKTSPSQQPHLNPKMTTNGIKTPKLSFFMSFHGCSIMKMKMEEENVFTTPWLSQTT